MIPLFHRYSMKVCEVDDCSNKPSTIIDDVTDSDGDQVSFCLCEKHYLEAKETGKITFRLDFTKNDRYEPEE